MQNITNKITTLYQYNGKFYKIVERKGLRINDIFIDGRDYGVKIIESNKDLFDASFIAPELYCILEEETIQN